MTRDLAQFVEISDSQGTTLLKIVDAEVLSDHKDLLYSLAGGETRSPLTDRVVLNLANVHSFKSVMIATLINFQKQVKERGGSLKICCIDPDVLRLFKLTKMDQILDLRGDEQDAIGSFRPGSTGWISKLFGSR